MFTYSIASKRCRVAMLTAAMISSAAPAEAAPVDLAHPTVPPHQATNIGAGDEDRGAVFDALATFTISSAGIFFDPLAGGATGIAVDIYLSNLGPGAQTAGHGPLQATASTAIADLGLGFYDVPISFTFVAGNRYDLAFRSTSGGWGFGQNEMRFYDFDFFSADPSYDVAGLVRVLDGACHTSASCGNYGNTVMPNVRFDVVPEPTTLILFGFGLAMLDRARRAGRRRSSAAAGRIAA